MLNRTVSKVAFRALLLAGCLYPAAALAQTTPSDDQSSPLPTQTASNEVQTGSTANSSTQTAPTSDQTNTAQDQVENILVTAQRRVENVQDVPIAMTALGSQELENRSVREISDLASATPNVTFSGTAQGTSATTIGIRGLRTSNVELVNDQPAALYIDGVYQSTVLGSTSLLGPDLERVEVLRGPQGTLFGRNTVAGAVLITTRRPQHEWGARFMIGFGNHGFHEGQAMLNIPIVPDVISARFNVGYRDDNGYAREVTYGSRLGRYENLYLRGQVLIEPTSSFDVLISADYLRSYSEGIVWQPVALTPPSFRGVLTPNTSASLAFTSLAIFYGLAPTQANYNTIRDLYFSCGGPRPNFVPRCFSPSPTNPFTTTGFFAGAASMNPEALYREYGGSVTATLNLTDDIQLKSITAYRDFFHNAPKDYDAGFPIILFSRANPTGQTFTQEANLTGTLFDDRLNFALGGFYYHFDGTERGTNTSLANIAGNNAANYIQNDVVNKSLGAYSQVTFAITDALRATAGLRYTDESKSVSIQQYGSRAAPVFQVCTLPVPNAQCVNTAELNYNSWDWTLGADYHFTDDIMAYVRVAKGFQAGGINQRSTTGVPFQVYLPQTAINYELGFKADLLDRHVRLNVAAFQSDVEGFQRSVPQTFLNAQGVPVSVVATINAADVRIRGVEAELTVVPFENFRISGQVGYLDPEYLTFLATGPLGPNTLDLSNTDFQQISDWTFGISPAYTLPTSWGEIHFQADYFYQSRQNLQPSLAYPLENEIANGLVQEGYGILNARIAARIHGDTEIALWAKNLTDERYFVGGLNLVGSLGFSSAAAGAPRTFGIQLSHEFR